MKLALTIIFLVIAVIMSFIVLMQDDKSAGLSGSFGGGGETYWSKNKGHSKEGILEKVTIVLVILFFVLALVLGIGIFK